MSPVLLAFLLMFQLKPTCFLRLFLFSALGLARQSVLFLLKLYRLLRLGADTLSRSLFSDFTLNALRITYRLTCNSCHSRAESQFSQVLENEFVNLVILGFSSEGHLATESFPRSCDSNTPTQNGSSKYTVRVQLTLPMTIPPLRIDEQRTDNPEGQVTYLEDSRRPGYLPALAHP